MIKPRIGLFVSFTGQGGVERVTKNLARGLAEIGWSVDLILAKLKGEHAADLPPGVRVIDLRVRHTLTALPRLVRYLRRETPDVLMAIKHRGITTAVLARAFAGVPLPLAGQVHTTTSSALKGLNPFRKALRYGAMRCFYRFADGIVGVSEGVAEDVRNIAGLSGTGVVSLPNAVITPELYALARAPVGHAWFQPESECPVILGIGRLTRQKNFEMLIEAFAEVRRTRPCRLMILGDGEHRAGLEDLKRRLGLNQDVELPGFQANPYAYLAHSQLFVLSSRWEGSPTVLTEAMALGIPVVPTDCPRGPRETLDGGRFGRLVAMEDPQALAAAMLQTLESPLPADTLQAAVRRFSMESSAAAYSDYLRALIERYRPRPV